MKIKTSELTGAALDWAVTKCEGYGHEVTSSEWGMWGWATDWAQGGPIIEREGVDILKLKPRYKEEDNRGWRAYHTPTPEARTHTYAEGPTPLIAAMRCYCCAKLGGEIDVPEELCQQQSS